MDCRERRDNELPYLYDQPLIDEFVHASDMVYELNLLDRRDSKAVNQKIRELFGKADDSTCILLPFYCDYGFHIEVGKHFFANYNCAFVDAGKITFGDHCYLGPAVQIYTAGHPIHPECRNYGFEYGIPVTVGDNVWIGGGTVVCPGVHIGSNTMIGAGSVVTKDIPDWVVAAGNPCKVIRKITDEDKKYYFHDREFDPEYRDKLTEAGILPERENK